MNIKSRKRGISNDIEWVDKRLFFPFSFENLGFVNACCILLLHSQEEILVYTFIHMLSIFSKKKHF